MPTYTSTGNFLLRPNRGTFVGFKKSYHFHNFDHTVIPRAGRWKVRKYAMVSGDLPPGFDLQNPDDTLLVGWTPGEQHFVAEVLIAPELFTPPGETFVPWVVVEKDHWHSLELISLTAYGADGQTVEAPFGDFLCCFSLRDYTGQVVEHYTGWQGAFM